MKIINKTRWLAIGVVLLGLSAIFSAQQGSSEFPLDVALKGVGSIHIFNLTYGTKITFGNPGILPRLLAKVPSKYKPAGLQSPSSKQLPSPALILSYHEMALAPVSQGNLIFEWVDENGIESSGDVLEHAGFDGANRSFAVTFSSFPRRSKFLTLRVYNSGFCFGPQFRLNGPANPNAQFRSWPSPHRLLLGQVTLTNPFLSHVPQWTMGTNSPQRLVDDSVCELVEASWTDRHGRTGEGRNQGFNWTCLKLKISKDSLADDDWSIKSVVSEDATGNSFRTKVTSCDHTNGLYTLWFDNSLWPVEPIRYRLALERANNYSPNELLAIANVTVPANGGHTSIGLSTNLNGQSFTVEGLAGAHRPNAGSSRTFFLDSPLPILEISFRPLEHGENKVKLLTVEDGKVRGREVKFYQHGNPTKEVLYYDLDLWDFSHPVKTIAITIAVPETKFVEFTVKPAKLAANHPD